MKQTKLEAKEAMLKQLSKKSKDSSYEGFGKELAEKKKPMEKVTVMAPDKEGLEKGLSMAQKLMKAKFGPMEESEDEYEDCPMCKGEGCSECEEPEEEEDEE